MRINRMSTWSAANLVFSELVASHQGLRVQGEGGTYACRLELDINTPPDYAGAIAPAVAPAVLDELMALGTEIARRGDVE
jgi:hypothetical protein